MIKSCKECMEGAPYDCCCKIECGQHEFCRSCKFNVSNCIKLCEENLNNKEVNIK